MQPDDSPPTTPDAGRVLEVDSVLAEFDGDARAAIAALLHDLDALARDAAEATSRGYVRGRFFQIRPIRERTF